MPAVLENLEVSTGVYKHRFGINALNGLVKVINESIDNRQLISDFPNALHDVAAVFVQGFTATTITLAFTDTKNVDAKHNIYFRLGIGPWNLDATLNANLFSYTIEGLVSGAYEVGVTAVSATRESSNIISNGFVFVIP